MSSQPSATTGNAPSEGAAANKQGKGATGGAAGTAGTGADTAAIPTPERRIKPIKTKVELPGVDTGYNRESPFDQKIAEALGRDPETGETSGLDMADGEQFGEKPRLTRENARKPTIQVRGADGKFTRTAPHEGAEGEESAGAEDAEGVATEGEVKTPELPPGFEDMEPGEEETLESLAEKHQKLLQRSKSLQGQFKNLNDQVRGERERSSTILREQHAAAKSATAWKAHAERLQTRIAELEAKSGSPAGSAPSPGTAGGSDQSIAGLPANVQVALKGIDWQMYRSAQAQGDDAAAVYLVSEVLRMAEEGRKADIEALRKELADFRDPIIQRDQESEHSKKVAAHALEVFKGVADIMTDEGKPAYPELYDEQEAMAVGQLWSMLGEQLGINEEMMFTPMGVVQAILAYRHFLKKPAAPATAATELPEGEEEGEQESPVNPVTPESTTRGIRALTGSRSTPVPTNGKDPVANFKASLRALETSDGDFGFPTRRTARRL